MRQPISNGFYPMEKTLLKKILENLIETKPKNQNIKGIIVPHAGYLYSGETAASAYSLLKKNYESFILICPDHTGMAKDVSISTEDWITPLGKIEIDLDLAHEIEKQTNLITTDNLAHLYEHSIEVQLPFLQHIYTNPKIVPIIIPNHINKKKQYQEIANAIKKATHNKKVLIITTTDFTHFGEGYNFTPTDKNQLEWVINKDKEIINNILSDNIEETEQSAKETTCCGLNPILLTMYLLKNAKLIKYDTSYTKSKNNKTIVGYGSIIFEDYK
jgi:MEMO1 family protein